LCKSENNESARGGSLFTGKAEISFLLALAENGCSRDGAGLLGADTQANVTSRNKYIINHTNVFTGLIEVH